MTKPQPAIKSGRASVPLAGHAWEFLKGNPWQTISQWALRPERIAKFSLFGRTIILLANPEHIRSVLTQVDKYPKDLKSTGYAAFKPILGNGLVLSQGDLWRRQRAVLSRAFRAELLHHVIEIADAGAARLAAELRTVQGSGVPFDFLKAFRSLTLQVIAEAVLSIPFKVVDEVFPRLYLPLVEEANRQAWMPVRRYLPTKQNVEFRRAAVELDKFVADVIERRHREGNPTGRKDILDRMLAAQATSGEPWDDACVAQLRDEIKTFLMAGHETTSVMLTWALFELTRHPAAMERVIAEAEEVFGHDSPPEALVKGLKYTEAVLRETLRRYSVVPNVMREASEDDMLGEYPIAKANSVVVAIDAVHHDPKLWPNPEAFEPERFLAPLPHPYAFLAFTPGSRSCIGEHFALLEAKVILARLVREFRILRAVGNDGRRHRFNTPIAPTHPMLLHVERHA